MKHLVSVVFLLGAAACGVAGARNVRAPVSAKMPVSVPQVPCPLDTPWTSSVPAVPRPEYPRPGLTRDEETTYATLNGAWEWQASNSTGVNHPPFGQSLSGSILVPFPVESCLSGVNETHMYMFYRLVFDLPSSFAAGGNVLVHFEAVDWQTQVWFNGELLGQHTGGYDRFSFVLPSPKATGNEIIVWVYDPTDTGAQPFGKQKLSALTAPSGDHYTPSSGIWAPVWLERVPDVFVSGFKVDTTLSDVTVTVNAQNASALPVLNTVFNVTVRQSGMPIAWAAGFSGIPLRLAIPEAHPWTQTDPYLYTFDVSLVPGGSAEVDVVSGYFGLRTVALCKDGSGTTRPCLNGKPLMVSGWLDQRWWPDGQYAAPTDEAILFDVQAALDNGFNFVRVHQKVEAERFYYYTDTLGLIVWQDAVQHFFGNNPSYDYFLSDLTAMVEGRYNHPSIIQWEIFNEADCVTSFDPLTAVSLLRSLDSSRLVDTNSGGPANGVASDVNDIHDYPNPRDFAPSDNQYAAIGEFGGLGWFPPQQYFPGRCYTYEKVDTPDDLVNTLVGMIRSVDRSNISAITYTQLSDLESECDGIYSYSRIPKLDTAQTLSLAAASQAFINDPLP